MQQKPTNSSIHALALNDENHSQRSSHLIESETRSQPPSTGRTKRRCVIESEKNRSKILIDDDTDFVPISVPKKEPVLGRRRGRPPLKLYTESYVFSTRLANACSVMVSSSPQPSTITDWHKRCIKPNSVLSQETIRSAVDFMNKIRGSLIPMPTIHQRPPVVEGIVHPSAWANIQGPQCPQGPQAIFTSLPPNYVNPSNITQFNQQYLNSFTGQNSTMPFHIHQLNSDMILRLESPHYSSSSSQQPTAGPPPLQALPMDDRAYIINDCLPKDRQQQ